MAGNAERAERLKQLIGQASVLWKFVPIEAIDQQLAAVADVRNVRIPQGYRKTGLLQAWYVYHEMVKAAPETRVCGQEVRSLLDEYKVAYECAQAELAGWLWSELKYDHWHPSGKMFAYAVHPENRRL